MTGSRADEECEDHEPEVEALPGGVAGSGGPDVLAELLLDMSAGALKACVLLGESDDEDWKSIGPRLSTFLSLVQQFPTGPRPRRRMGFQVATEKPGRKTKKVGRTNKKRGKKNV